MSASMFDARAGLTLLPLLPTCLRALMHKAKTLYKKIVAIDDTWVRSYEPELKRQPVEWHTQNSEGFSQNSRC